MTVAQIRRFIKQVRWQLAKDKSHSYSVRSWCPELSDAFTEFVDFIYENGYKEKYFKVTFTYLQVDDFI